MRTYEKLAVSGLIFLGGFLGCGAGNVCESEPDRAECQSPSSTPSPTVVSPVRIALTKDASTTVTVFAGGDFAQKAVTLRQQGNSLQIGVLNAEGGITTALSATDLAAKKFLPGPASIEVADKSGTSAVYLYLTPHFDPAPVSLPQRDVSKDRVNGTMTTDATPVNLAISQNKVIAVNYYETKIGPNIKKRQNVATYAFDGTTLGAPTYPPSSVMDRFSDAATGVFPGISVTSDGYSVSGIESSTPAVLTCGSTCSITYYDSFSSLVSFSGAQRGNNSLYVGLFDKTAVKAYSDLALTKPFDVAGLPASLGEDTKIIAGDFDGDGTPDFATIDSKLAVSAFFRTATTPTRPYTKDDTCSKSIQAALKDASPSTVAFGDLDQDGLDDIVFVSSSNQSLTLLINQGDGTFKAEAPIVLPAAIAGVSTIAIGEVQNKGDIVLASDANRFIALLRNMP